MILFQKFWWQNNNCLSIRWFGNKKYNSKMKLYLHVYIGNKDDIDNPFHSIILRIGYLLIDYTNFNGW